MSDELALLFVLVFIYLAECVFWVRRDWVAFSSLFSERFRLRYPESLGANQHGRFLLSNPLPPLGSVFLCQRWPLSLSPNGVCAPAPLNGTSSTTSKVGPKYVSFEDIRTVRTSDGQVVINGEVFVRRGSTRFARQLAELLSELSKLPVQERHAFIEKTLRRTVNLEEIDRLICLYWRDTASLRILCNALFVYLFMVCPVVSWIVGFNRCWLFLLLGLLAGLAVTAIQFYRAHHRLYPEESADRWSHVVKMVLAPPIAIRALDALAWELLSSYHPLAVAYTLCTERTFLDYARWALRDARFPVASLGENGEPSPLFTEDWFRDKSRHVLEEFLRRVGVEPEELLAPKLPTEDSLSLTVRAARRNMLSLKEPVRTVKESAFTLFLTHSFIRGIIRVPAASRSLPFQQTP